MYGILDKTTNIKYYGHPTMDSANDMVNEFIKIDNGEYFGHKAIDNVNYNNRYEVFEYNKKGK